MSAAPVSIIEVGPRDGLQNEATPVATADKRRFIDLLIAAGLTEIEVTSFVSPRAVPQLADAEALLAALPRPAGVVYSALVPNARGLERALAAGVDKIAVFTGASDAFTQRNIGLTVAESLAVFGPVVAAARRAGRTVRGYISVGFGCPYSGPVAPTAVVALAERLLALGCDELAVADTIGVVDLSQLPAVVEPLLTLAGAERLALHLHDTRGRALDCVVAAYRLGVCRFDAAAGGLGGCPFAPGAPGNLATEALVSCLQTLGIPTGLSHERLAAASRFIFERLGRPPRCAAPPHSNMTA